MIKKIYTQIETYFTAHVFVLRVDHYLRFSALQIPPQKKTILHQLDKKSCVSFVWHEHNFPFSACVSKAWYFDSICICTYTRYVFVNCRTLDCFSQTPFCVVVAVVVVLLIERNERKKIKRRNIFDEVCQSVFFLYVFIVNSDDYNYHLIVLHEARHNFPLNTYFFSVSLFVIRQANTQFLVNANSA